MEKVGVFIDLCNIGISFLRNFQSKRLSFTKIMDVALDKRYPACLNVYDAISHRNDEVNIHIIQGKGRFHEVLEEMGFDVKVKEVKSYPNPDGTSKSKADWDMGMAVDILESAEDMDLDVVVIVSGDGDFVPLVGYLKRRFSLRVECMAVRDSLSPELASSVDRCVIIDESFARDHR